jgi:hypothetical protein
LRHLADPDFWAAYEQLPEAIKRAADRAFERVKTDPAHPSLRFKRTGRHWSVRTGLPIEHWPIRTADFVWFWIGTHGEYDQLVG